MRNRAKCKACNEILESFHEFDYVSCKCGEIGISGGLVRYEVSARNPENFLRVDDDGHEIPVTWKEKEDMDKNPPPPKKMTKKEAIEELNNRLQYMENMREDDLYRSVSQSEFYQWMALLVYCLRD